MVRVLEDRDQENATQRPDPDVVLRLTEREAIAVQEAIRQAVLGTERTIADSIENEIHIQLLALTWHRQNPNGNFGRRQRQCELAVATLRKRVSMLIDRPRVSAWLHDNAYYDLQSLRGAVNAPGLGYLRI